MSATQTPQVDPFAGQSLAQIAAYGDTPQVRLSLQVRIDRQGKSAKNAAGALARLNAGGSVAIPTPEPKAPKAPKGTNPNAPALAGAALAAVNAKAQTTQMPAKLAFDFAAKALKAAGHPVPRALAKAARTGEVPVKVKA